MADHLGHAHGRIHGVTTYFLETLPAFDRARVVPSLYVLQPRHAAAERFVAAGVRPVFFGRAKSDPRALVDVLGLLGRRRIDVLHLCGLKSLLLGRVAARLKGYPVVAHFHDTIPAPGWMRGLQRRLASSTDLALAVSEPIRDFAIRDFAISPERIQVLHNGIDVARFSRPPEAARRRIRAELRLSPSRPTIGLIGRVHEVKGQRAMIRALPRLLRQCPEAVLVIVGEGPDRDACAALVRDLGLQARVRFTGQRDDVPDLLAAVDLVVVPSMWKEPFGFVALEAMAAGRPVVAFRIGGLPEIIVHGETGLLVPHADEDALADAAAQVLSQPHLVERLGAAAVRSAGEFTIRKHVERLATLYDEVLLRRSPPRRDRASPAYACLGSGAGEESRASLTRLQETRA